MNNLSPERRKAVVLASCCACMAGGPVLLKNHPVLIVLWVIFEASFCVAALVMLRKAVMKEKVGR